MQIHKHTQTLAHSKDSHFWSIFFLIQNIDVIALQKANQSWYYQLCCVCVCVGELKFSLSRSLFQYVNDVYNFQVCNSSFVLFLQFTFWVQHFLWAACLFHCWSDKTIRCELKSPFPSYCIYICVIAMLILCNWKSYRKPFTEPNSHSHTRIAVCGNGDGSKSSKSCSTAYIHFDRIRVYFCPHRLCKR